VPDHRPDFQDGSSTTCSRKSGMTTYLRGAPGDGGRRVQLVEWAEAHPDVREVSGSTTRGPQGYGLRTPSIYSRTCAYEAAEAQTGVRSGAKEGGPR